MTVVSSLSELLPDTGSVVTELILAVLVIVPEVSGFTLTVIVILGAAPAARLGCVHVTIPAASPHVQPVPLALTKVTPAGNVSVTVTVFGSRLGPALETSRV